MFWRTQRYRVDTPFNIFESSPAAYDRYRQRNPLRGIPWPKTDPNYYRAITLSSAILKVYELLLLDEVKNEMTAKLSPLQFGFQKSISFSMTLFLLKECICYAKEAESKLYSCFLDIKKLFYDIIFVERMYLLR